MPCWWGPCVADRSRSSILQRAPMPEALRAPHCVSDRSSLDPAIRQLTTCGPCSCSIPCIDRLVPRCSSCIVLGRSWRSSPKAKMLTHMICPGQARSQRQIQLLSALSGVVDPTPNFVGRRNRLHVSTWHAWCKARSCAQIFDRIACSKNSHQPGDTTRK